MANKLKFSANLKWLFTEFPLEQRYDAAAAAGFIAAEFACPYDHPVSFFKTILKNSGLNQVLINTPVGRAGTSKSSGQACHPDSVESFKSDFQRAVEYAVGLNCKTIHLQAGIRQPDVSVDAAWATLVENVRWAAEQAGKEKVNIVIEAINPNDIPGFLIQTQAQSLSLIRDIDAKNVGLLFDIYHVQRSEGDVTARMRKYFGHISHVQVADSPGRNEPGSGELNWDYILDELITLGYSGWVGCEYRPVSSTLAGLHWLDRFR